MLKKTCLLFTILLFISTSLPAQEIIFEGVEKTWLRDSGPITQNDEVAGYYFFYGLKKRKGKRPYILEIYDQDLNKTATKEITSKRSLYLDQGAYDGENIMLQFYDNGEYRYNVYNQQAELISSVTRPAYEYVNIDNLPIGVNDMPKTLFTAPQGGFISYSGKPGKKRTEYEIEYFDSMGQPVWLYAAIPDSKKDQLATLLTLNDRVVINFIGKRPRLNSRKMNYSLSCLDIQTGTELFTADLQNDQYSITLINGEIDETTGEILLFGEYYPFDANQLKSPSLGLFTARIDASGQMSQEKYISWEKDISKFLPVDKTGKQSGKGFTWFHKVIKTKDGKIFAIGEQFRNVVDGVALAGEVVSGISAILFGGGYIPGGNIMKMVVDDMVIYEFSPEFELINIKVLEKDKVSFQLPGGDYYTTRILARQIDAYGYFGYAFTKMDEEGNNFSVGYVEEDTSQKSFLLKTFFHTLSYEDGEYVENKVEISPTKRATASRIHPAKAGHIMITEYFRKEKKVVSRLEKIDK